VTDASLVRPSGRRRRPGPWLLAALVLAAAALPGGLAAAHAVRLAPEVGVAHPLAAATNFTVNLTDAPSYTPRYLNATAGGALTVSVFLNNTGSIAHTFTVAAQSGVVLNRSWTPQQLDAYFVANGSLVNKNVSGGSSVTVSFVLNASTSFRSFEFVSTIPYQFQAGMWGFLNITPAGPTLVLSDNTTNNFQFVPNVLSGGPTVHTGATFDVLVTNLGSLSHTFTVYSQPNVTLTSLGSLAKHPPLVNRTINASANVWANFTVSAVGVYEYVCTVSGHFTAGMFGFLYVGVPVPPPPPAPSTAIVEVPILVGSALLLGVGLVLAVASALAGRFPKKPTSGEHHP
jgi:uncharacterized cupredoxin-like copper-binding protein